jgi:hypothetical protein
MHCYSVSSVVLLMTTFLSFSKSLDMNCTTESFMLYNDTEFAKADMKKGLFMNTACNQTTPNHMCSSSYSTDNAGNHAKATMNMTSAEADQIRYDYKIACKEAGGQIVLCSFDIGLHGEKMNYWDMKTLDVFIVGYPECVGLSTCNNQTAVGDYIKAGWEYFFNASTYNFTLYEVKWDNITTSQ